MPPALYPGQGNTMKLKTLIAAAAITCAAWSACAGVEVRDAWVRFTVKGQQATGAFMTLTARQGTRLVDVSSPAAGVSQLHQMTLDHGVMRMNAVKGGLDLPAGQVVELKPGGYHVMLMDLKSTLVQGASVPLTLRFKDALGVASQLELQLPVAAVAPAKTAP